MDFIRTKIKKITPPCIALKNKIKKKIDLYEQTWKYNFIFGILLMNPPCFWLNNTLKHYRVVVVVHRNSHRNSTKTKQKSSLGKRETVLQYK